MLNLLRLNPDVGYQSTAPLRSAARSSTSIQRCGDVPDEEMWEVFNMGCGFCVVVPAAEAAAAVALLERHHPGAAQIGALTADADRVSVPSLGLTF